MSEHIESPANLEQAICALDKIIEHDTRRIIQELDEEQVSAIMHHTLGRFIRNKWGLWQNSKLCKWFESKGIHHPDDMSGIIITSYWRQQRDQLIQLQEQIQHYLNYWAEAEKAETINETP